MSASGPISNYYVDSLIGHDNEELLASRFGGPGAARPAGLVPDCGDFPSCSFAPADFMYGAPGELRDRAAQTIPSSPESEAIASSKHKEEKHELDPSKSKSFLFTTAEGITASRTLLNKMKLP
ncbi:PREDICTED: homeobox protein Hox-C9 [Corvus brachyrhynchos]|uniref:homeobox protein Hox-C9 n=1 Tax=Corvus brachyrhynchos TaxID=85066 RepID=UPI000816562E|nr:PREDICTED: homeobox protein Hox-C9 [Corvus brachyrhynchos]